jgi:hypothetical protein
MFKIYGKAAREGGDRSETHEEREDTDNESEMNEDITDRTSLPKFHELTWMAQEDTDSFETDEEATSEESDSGSDEENIDDRLDSSPRLIPHTYLPAKISQHNQETLEHDSCPPTVAWKAPDVITQHPPPAQRYSRGVCMDRGEEAWLNLE